MVKVEGKNGISATVIADSINAAGDRMMTFELVYPRFILAEVNTHRAISKNSASSRAIPIKSTIDHVKSQPAMPVHWGKNQPGMQAKEELDGTAIERVKHLWNAAKDSAIHYLEELQNAGLHKQVASRIIEPWFMMKTVASGTEWDNVEWLRYHEDAQPEFYELTRCIVEARSLSKPVKLGHGQWHLPYVKTFVDGTEIRYFDLDGNDIDLQQAIRISASCCAQVSYRKLDGSVEKADDIFQKLFSGQKVHASPVEHQATPFEYARVHDVTAIDMTCLPEGTTHIRIDGTLWSGNLRGWRQLRQTMANHTKWRD